MKFKLKRVAAGVALLAPVAAHADPVTAVTLISAGLQTLGYINAAVAFWITTGAAVYGTISARRKAKKMQEAERQRYNSKLEDRSATALRAIPYQRYIFGRVVTGGDVVNIVTSDKQGTKPNGSTYTKPDALKHLVIVFAQHQCQEAHDLRIDGESVYPLNADGWSENPIFKKNAGFDRTAEFSVTGSYTLPEGVLQSDVLTTGTVYAGNPGGDASDYTEAQITLKFGGTGNRTVTVDRPGSAPLNNGTVRFSYKMNNAGSTVRVSWHLGTANQAADPYLVSVAPTKYNESYMLRGRTYAVVTLDLEETRFQGGPPGITADISGMLHVDPRDGQTKYTNNSAICINTFLRAKWGLGCSDPDDVETASLIASCNTCDEETDLGRINNIMMRGPRYTCNGVYFANDDKEATLEEMARSMAGNVTQGAQWLVQAGAWTVPVRDLTDDDLDGSIELLQAGVSIGELFNGVRGTYIPAGKQGPTDFPKYQNSTFKAADGEDLWEDVAFGFVDHPARCTRLARIMVEQNRDGLIIKYPAKLGAWDLKVGERVRVTSPEWGFVQKTFRITDWSFTLQGAVLLTLLEDGPASWDDVDATDLDQNQNTLLPNPNAVPAVALVQAVSGNATIVRTQDGTIRPRVRIDWLPLQGPYMNGDARIYVRWRLDTENDHKLVEVPADSTSAIIEGVTEGAWLIATVYAVNSLLRKGPETMLVHKVVGKSARPADVTGFAASVGATGIVLGKDAAPDADVDLTEVRSGADWDTGVPITGEYPTQFAGTSYLWQKPSAGNYKLWAKHLDTSGNYSQNAVSVDVVVGATELLAWGNVSGRPKLFRAVAAGWNVVVPSVPGGGGLYDGETGVLLVGRSRSYSMARIRRSDGVVTFGKHYDVFNNGAVDPDWPNNPGQGNGPAQLAEDLNASTSDHIVVVWTDDEPRARRMDGGLPAAMYRCGASRSVFGSPEFQSRAAYVLVGIPGVGEGNGYEAYQQDTVPGDRSAWCDVSFQLLAGQLIAANGNYVPRTLKDFSYTGDLNATNTLTLLSHGSIGVTVEGSTVRRESDAGGNWGVSGAYSREGFNRGAYCMVQAGTANCDIMFGLDRTPTEDAGYANIDAAIYLNGNGTFEVYQSGTAYGPFGNYTVGDWFLITQDGQYLRYYKNGTEVFFWPWQPNVALYFDSSFSRAGQITNVRFGPFTSIQDSVTAAANAQTTASNAANAAANALNALGEYASDNVLTPLEKQRVIQDWNVLAGERNGILAQAEAYGVAQNVRDNYWAAVQNVGNYLVTLNPGWADLNASSAIDGGYFRSVWQGAYLYRQECLDNIVYRAKERLGSLATMNSVGSGNIDDGAATQPVTTQVATDSLNSARNGNSVQPPVQVRYKMGTAWTNNTGAWRLVQIECSARLFRGGNLSGSSSARLVFAKNPLEDYSHGDGDLVTRGTPFTNVGADFARVAVETVGPGETIYAYLAFDMNPVPDGGITSATWRDAFVRVTAIVK